MNKFIYCTDKDSAEKLIALGASLIQHNSNENTEFWIFASTRELDNVADKLPQCFISNRLNF